MGQPTFRQAARLIQLAVDCGWDSELTQFTLIERWRNVRDFVMCLHAGLISEDEIRRLRKALDPEKADWSAFIRAQARRYYTAGWREYSSTLYFGDYLTQCPHIPMEMRVYDQRYPYLVLVDSRPGLDAICAMLRVDKRDMVSPNETLILDRPYWIRCHRGWRNRDKCPIKLAERLDPSSEMPLSIIEALSLYAQHPRIMKSVDIDIIQHDSEGRVLHYGLAMERKGVAVLSQTLAQENVSPDPRCGLATKKVFSSG